MQSDQITISQQHNTHVRQALVGGQGCLLMQRLVCVVMEQNIGNMTMGGNYRRTFTGKINLGRNGLFTSFRGDISI